MRRSLLAISIFSLLSASSLFASPESDLLSKATDGAITTAKAEGVKVLSNDEMGDVKGVVMYGYQYGASYTYRVYGNPYNVPYYSSNRGYFTITIRNR